MVPALYCVETYHFTDSQTIQHTSTLIPKIVKHGTLSRVERNPKLPLLPSHEIVVNPEAGPIRLHDGKRLEILPRTVGKKLWDVFCRVAVIDDASKVGPTSERVVSSTGGGHVDTDDFSFVVVHDWDDGERVRVEVGVWVAAPLVLGEEEGLEDTFIVIACIWGTVWPGFDDDFKTFRETQLVNLFFDSRRGLDALDYLVKLPPTRVIKLFGVLCGEGLHGKTGLALGINDLLVDNLGLGQVDNRFMILRDTCVVNDIVPSLCQSWRTWRLSGKLARVFKL